MPEWSKPGETYLNPSLDENQRRVVRFFMLLDQIPVGEQNAEEASLPDSLSENEQS